MAAENGEKLTIIIDLSACMGYIYTFMRSPVICAHAVYIRNRFCFFYNPVVNMHFHPACTCNNGGRCWCMVLGLLAWAKMCVLCIYRMPFAGFVFVSFNTLAYIMLHVCIGYNEKCKLHMM